VIKGCAKALCSNSGLSGLITSDLDIPGIEGLKNRTMTFSTLMPGSSHGRSAEFSIASLRFQVQRCDRRSDIEVYPHVSGQEIIRMEPRSLSSRPVSLGRGASAQGSVLS